ncbi:competence type IV pilus major pilin ComGC [Geodermatophilus sp. SYSU D01036]
MLAYIRNARKNDEGFTLIELLMVIVILGVLAGIVVFAVGGINDRGEQAACDADLRTVQTAVEAYYANPAGGDGSYPTALGDLVPEYLRSVPTTVALGADGAVTSTC